MTPEEQAEATIKRFADLIGNTQFFKYKGIEIAEEFVEILFELSRGGDAENGIDIDFPFWTSVRNLLRDERYKELGKHDDK